MRSIFIIIALLLTSCGSNHDSVKKIIFLHHSTGHAVWVGKTNRYIYKVTGKGDVQKFFIDYNRVNKTKYVISELIFPKKDPYGWNNYPYDYYNIWVRNAGENPFMEEPTLEILTRGYDIIIFKHCYPVSRISEGSAPPVITSPVKSIENYKLQYNALKDKMHEFPDKKFIVWTPAVNTKQTMTEDEAIRTRQFYDWMIKEWNEEGDNIFVWDFYKYETEGGMYLANKNAHSPNNSHPNKEFSGKMAMLFGQYIIDVIEGMAD